MGISLGGYLPWIRRAEAFVRQLNSLPGRWGISIAIEPPITQSEADEIAKTLPFGLPTPLRQLYTEGAGKCVCRYRWSPDQQHLPLVQKVFPHQMSFGGGAAFIPWTELLAEHAVHTWWDGQDENLTKEILTALKVWRRTVPFISVGNGDYVALHVTDDPHSMPVVYLCHDDPENSVTYLSPSLDQFLDDWELLCYIGPEIWLLSAFLGDNGRGPLDVRQEIVQQWREVLLHKHEAIS